MVYSKFNSNGESFSQLSQCFKVRNLKETILDANQISNLKDQYILGDQLGWGQFGVIRTCADKFTGELFACKSIAKNRLVTQNDVQSVNLEIDIMTRLSGHPNVVDLEAVYEEEDYVHLVMELCSGGELFHQLEKQGRYSESQARDLFRQLMQVVFYCHDNGVVHRDLKPENILLTNKATSSPIKLADFGLATYIKPGQNLHGTVGSPFYIAPEVLSGGYTQAADVWSSGVILYILLSGVPPFWGRTKSRIFDAVRSADLNFPSDPWDSISESAKDLIRKMLCIDPLKRFTAEQVLAHPWMEEASSPSEDSYSFSFIARDRDVSFGMGSSLTSFFVQPSATTLLSSKCSSNTSDESSSPEFSSPFPSMPSFTFFIPGLASEQASHGEADLEKPFTSPESSQTSRNDSSNPKEKFDSIKTTGDDNFRNSGVHSKRNQTIGLGEFDQLNIVVAESVIRWASCTHLPSVSSIRTSIVC